MQFYDESASQILSKCVLIDKVHNLCNRTCDYYVREITEVRIQNPIMYAPVNKETMRSSLLHIKISSFSGSIVPKQPHMHHKQCNKQWAYEIVVEFDFKNSWVYIANHVVKITPMKPNF